MRYRIGPVPAQKDVRPGKRATDDGREAILCEADRASGAAATSHRGWAVGAIAFERRVCRT
jgi:hypothetical protein